MTFSNKLQLSLGGLPLDVESAVAAAHNDGGSSVIGNVRALLSGLPLDASIWGSLGASGQTKTGTNSGGPEHSSRTGSGREIGVRIPLTKNVTVSGHAGVDQGTQRARDLKQKFNRERYGANFDLRLPRVNVSGDWKKYQDTNDWGKFDHHITSGKLGIPLPGKTHAEFTARKHSQGDPVLGATVGGKTFRVSGTDLGGPRQGFSAHFGLNKWLPDWMSGSVSGNINPDESGARVRFGMKW